MQGLKKRTTNKGIYGDIPCPSVHGPGCEELSVPHFLALDVSIGFLPKYAALIGKLDSLSYKRICNFIHGVVRVFMAQKQRSLDGGQFGVLGDLDFPQPSGFGKKLVAQGVRIPKLFTVYNSAIAMLV